MVSPTTMVDWETWFPGIPQTEMFVFNVLHIKKDLMYQDFPLSSTWEQNFDILSSLSKVGYCAPLVPTGCIIKHADIEGVWNTH